MFIVDFTYVEEDRESLGNIKFGAQRKFVKIFIITLVDTRYITFFIQPLT